MPIRYFVKQLLLPPGILLLLLVLAWWLRSTRPRLAGVLPGDRLVALDDPARARYDAAQAAAMRHVLREHAPAGVLINHATPLPAALAPELAASAADAGGALTMS